MRALCWSLLAGLVTGLEDGLAAGLSGGQPVVPSLLALLDGAQIGLVGLGLVGREDRVVRHLRDALEHLQIGLEL